MHLAASTTSVVAVAAAGAGGLGLLIALVLALRLHGLRRSVRAVGTEGVEALLGRLQLQSQELAAVRGELAGLRADVAGARADLADAIRHVAVVRYDAFSEMGGRLSFSAALLDDAGDGLVLTSINARSETRTYAKGVKSGGSEAPLSPEEQQAIGYARRGAPAQPAVEAVPDRPERGRRGRRTPVG